MQSFLQNKNDNHNTMNVENPIWKLLDDDQQRKGVLLPIEPMQIGWSSIKSALNSNRKQQLFWWFQGDKPQPFCNIIETEGYKQRNCWVAHPKNKFKSWDSKHASLAEFLFALASGGIIPIDREHIYHL